jgi:two-component system, OmpR family, phosphate regulon sensor histidine kinase PhoR
MKNNINKDTNKILHQSAEVKLGNKKQAVIQNMQTDEANALLHELQVHQIELKMQNEELKRANAQVESALSKYYELYDLAPVGYFTINEQGKILEVNQVGADLLDVKNRYLLNNYFQNYIAEDFLSLYKAFRTQVSESGTKQNCEIKLLKKGKAPFYVQITGIAVKSHNKAENQMWFSVLDITDRIKVEEAKEEVRKLHEDENNKLMDQMRMFDKLKTEYFSNLSHELRTPLNVILSSLKLLELRKRALEEEVALKLDKHISMIKQNSYRLLRLINNIIDMTKIESGFFEIHLKNCNIVSIVEDITLSVAEYIENKGISFLFDTDIEEKLMACDPDKVERIILNLLSNAIKFTKSGDSISVNVFERQEAVEIVVSDTGIGIPSDKQELIFQRFRQVDTSLTREQEGSGIGLSLVKSLVDMHEGTISLESEYGQGSKFIVRLPVKILDSEEKTGINMDNGSKQAQIERLNIEFSDIYSY